MLRGSGRVEGMLTRVFSVIVMCRMYVEAVSSAPGRRKRADMDLSVAFYGSFLSKRRRASVKNRRRTLGSRS